MTEEAALRRARRGHGGVIEETALRRARREERVRENELLRELMRMLPGPCAFCCECGRESCHEIFLVPEESIELVRSHATRLMMSPGHEVEGLDVVVERHAAFVLVDEVGT